jgi:hypothetical protein
MTFGAKNAISINISKMSWLQKPKVRSNMDGNGQGVRRSPPLSFSQWPHVGAHRKRRFLRIGLDDFSLKVFGQADGFELPLMGKELDHDKKSAGA